jgi:hypothetical protein
MDKSNFPFSETPLIRNSVSFMRIGFRNKYMNLHFMIQSFTGRPEEMEQIVPKHCKIRNA